MERGALPRECPSDPPASTRHSLSGGEGGGGGLSTAGVPPAERFERQNTLRALAKTAISGYIQDVTNRALGPVFGSPVANVSEDGARGEFFY